MSVLAAVSVVVLLSGAFSHPERLPPTSVAKVEGFSGSAADVDEDPWYVLDAAAMVARGEWTAAVLYDFDTPEFPPSEEPEMQSFSVAIASKVGRARPGAVAEVCIAVYDGWLLIHSACYGPLHDEPVPSSGVLQVVWTADTLTDPTGAGVQMLVSVALESPATIFRIEAAGWLSTGTTGLDGRGE